MHFWDDMNSKYGFNDGGAVPAEAYPARTVYVQTLNTMAARYGSNVRAVAYNRPGCHNPCLIVMVTVEQFKTVTNPISGEVDLDSFGNFAEPSDEAWRNAVLECEGMGLDDFVVSNPVISPDFATLLVDLAAGKEPHTTSMGDI